MALQQEQHGADIRGVTRAGNDDVDDDAMMATSLHKVARNEKPPSAAAMEAEAAASLTKILSLLSELEEAQRAVVKHDERQHLFER